MTEIVPILGRVVAIGTVLWITFKLAERPDRPRRANTEGWKRLRPGWVINISIAASLFVIGVLAHDLLNGGSRLPDAEFQNASAVILCLLSVAGAVFLAWIGYGRTIQWRGTELRMQSVFGRATTYDLTKTLRTACSFESDPIIVRLEGRREVRFTTLLKGARELAREISDLSIKIDVARRRIKKENRARPLPRAHRHIKRGDLAALIKVLNSGLDPNALTTTRATLLQSAAFYGPVAVGVELLNRGADIDAQDDCGHSALTLAAHRGHLSFVEMLLKHGASTANEPLGYPLEWWVTNSPGVSAKKAQHTLAALRGREI